MAEDGTTTLNILNPDNDGVISEKERVITLGQKIGKLKRGKHHMNMKLFVPCYSYPQSNYILFHDNLC